MPPIEQQQLLPVGTQHVMGLPGAQGGVQPGAISLSTLIDYIIQRTYHDLQVLSELLPRKTDMERKIEIVQFASRTRQLFVRLLALVKWANSASKVDKCGMISSFLDQQAVLFVETADLLARIARETLVHVRLPSFSLPCAIDVLTTGTYPRLPTCIKERIVPPDPISAKDKEETLEILEQIIEYRLVTSELPLHMRNLTIENGRVKFFVKHEFSATLTVMGDGPDIPWRLLDISILVEDPETGGGKALVHSLQVNYIHQLVQTRLMDNDAPLHDLYNCLHSFCQSLQLEVLHSQAQRLIQQRLRDHVKVDEYNPGKCLRLSYWRDNSRKFPGSYYKLSINVDEQNPSKPLQVAHAPQIQGSESSKVAQAIQSDHLSLEKLLIHTIQVRSTAKLKDLEREFCCHVPGRCDLRDLPTVLYVPVLNPCMATEKLSVAVNTQTGNFMVALGGKETELTEEIEECLNSDHRDLRKLLSKVRVWLGMKRCERSIHHIQAPVLYHLPLINAEEHPIAKLSADKLFVRLAKQHNYYMVVEVKETQRRALTYKHYILKAEPCVFEQTSGENVDDVPQSYLRPGSLVELDTFLLTHGPAALLHDVKEEPLSSLHRKRKLLRGEAVEPPNKRQMMSPYFLPELSHLIGYCEDKIPFVHLATCLEQNSILHQGIQVEADGVGLSLTLLDMPPCGGIGKEASERLQSDLLSCKIRLQRKSQRAWCMESIFANCPLKSVNPKEQGPVHRVVFIYELTSSEAVEKTVHSIIDDWNSLAQLYAAVLKFADIYNNNSFINSEDPELQNAVEIRSFTYKRLTLAYGPNKCYCVSVQYKNLDKQLHLSFGTCGQATMYNCHTLLQRQLEHQVNETRSVALLAKLLMETWGPMVAIGKLSTAPMQAGTMMGGSAQKQNLNLPVPTFTILPQTATHIRIVFRGCYCLDVHLMSNRIVAIRDGAYSNFDTSKVVEGLNPIQQLRAFLNLYVDESVCLPSRRRSTTEDDNPPSPIGMDTMDTFMSQQSNIGSPSTRKTDGLRFPGPMTPPSVQSNPHTPGSPSTRLSQQSNVAPSPSTALMGTPSPSTMLPQGSPNPALHVPSPSSFVPAPSPSSLGIHMPSPATQFISPQGMVEGGSPFPNTNLTMPSPGARNWPGSPSMPGPSPASRHMVHSPGYQALHSPQKEVMSPPSRILPQRSWAASMPTLLSHDAFTKLLTQSPVSGSPGIAPSVPCCPLERFLGSVFLRRHMQRVVQSEDNLHSIQTNEKSVVLFKVESLQFRISVHPHTMQSLQLKVAPTTGYEASWDTEDIVGLEKFFEAKVVCAPYKANAVRAFARILIAPIKILKDFIQIMKCELLPDRSLNWSLQWCLTVPHGAHIANTLAGPPAAVISAKGKILFLLQLTRQNVTIAPGQEPQTIIVPILHDQNSNSTQMTDQKGPGQGVAPATVNKTLRPFAEMNPMKQGECSVFPAVRELLTNLVV